MLKSSLSGYSSIIRCYIITWLTSFHLNEWTSSFQVMHDLHWHTIKVSRNAIENILQMKQPSICKLFCTSCTTQHSNKFVSYLSHSHYCWVRYRVRYCAFCVKIMMLRALFTWSEWVTYQVNCSMCSCPQWLISSPPPTPTKTASLNNKLTHIT